MSPKPASRARIWAALGIVYVVWGSTYLGILVAVRTLPPFLMASIRFLIAGGLLFRLRVSSVWLVLGAGIVGALAGFL